MHHIGTRQIETERLVLRRFTLADVGDAFQGWFSDPDVAMYMRWDAHSDLSQTKEFIARFVADYEKPDYYRWAIALKQDNRAIGAVGIHIESEYDSIADVSYTLSQAFWNQGIISEALRAVLQYALVDVGVNRVEAFHATDNPASGKVMLKAGMKYEGHARQKYRSHKGYEDCDLYAAIADDWLLAALKAMNPSGHQWLEKNEGSVNGFWSAIDVLVAQSEIVIDRPKGTKHPRFDFIYPLDYGYLKDTTSPDGGGIDVWRGSLRETGCDAVVCTIDLMKRDSEIKLLIGCTEEEKAAIMRFHNDSENMKGTMIRRYGYAC